MAPSNAVLLSPPARSGALYAGLTGGSGSSWLWQPPSGSLGQDSALGPADEELSPPGSWKLGADGKTGNIDSGPWHSSGAQDGLGGAGESPAHTGVVNV